MFDVGSQLLGFNPTPQGRIMASVLEAKDADGLPLFPEVVGLVPRRAAKTTSVWSVILGRCATIDGYQVATTAQDGTRARNILKAMARTLVANGSFSNISSADSDEDSSHDVIGKVRWANGSEALEFNNGSRVWAVPPRADAFRSEAADCLLFDEAGELDPAQSEDILEGALPLMDTRPLGQAIIVGTPAKARAGLLWDTLQVGRAGRPGTGIFDWSIRDDEDWFTRVDEGTAGAIEKDGRWYRVNEALVRRVHPGIGTLTTWAKMLQRFDKMGLPSFEREYLCRFPFDNATAAIDMTVWHAHAVEPEDLPQRFGLAFDVEIDSTAAALCAAWRDEQGVARVAVLDYRSGVRWLPSVAAAVARKYRVPLRYDNIGANFAPADLLSRPPHNRGVRIVPGGMRDTQAATQLFTTELSEGRLVHFAQSSLTEAAEGAAWRQTDGGRMFGRKASVNGISPLVAAALALWQFDQLPKQKPLTIKTSAR